MFFFFSLFLNTAICLNTWDICKVRFEKWFAEWKEIIRSNSNKICVNSRNDEVANTHFICFAPCECHQYTSIIYLFPWSFLRSNTPHVNIFYISCVPSATPGNPLYTHLFRKITPGCWLGLLAVWPCKSIWIRAFIAPNTCSDCSNNKTLSNKRIWA